MEESHLLVLGPEGAGKTLMLKRLQTISSQMSLPQAQRRHDLGEAPPTIPTVGVNLVTINLYRKKYTFRELGGAMGPIWSKYFKDANLLVFIIDTANRTKISSSCIQLLDVLSSKQTINMPVALIFNKVDSPSCMPMAELLTILRLNDIILCAKHDITIIESSFRTGQGIDEIMKWLKLKAGPKKRGSFAV
ncbi:ADP-ribosylation factor-like protein 16 [Actinia tenebrosa]|uniref:ADP-ribosylation factor-like protein 16 n=1 Tax=Actinia tenebrosa TaxID=6105 RepID=A0A6P8IEW7_ACTTE|nr:ADP-ribosylation factor-like protein 16 [Actinia tenebrosa]